MLTPEQLSEIETRMHADDCRFRVDDVCDCALEERIAYLISAITATESELNWRENHSCAVCLGEPLASGKTCICKGGGSAAHEAQGLRELLVKVESERDALQEKLDAMRSYIGEVHKTTKGRIGAEADTKRRIVNRLLAIIDKETTI